MECHTAEGMIVPFIHHSLPDDELEAFLTHIDRCPSCKEELEINYIVQRALTQLSEDEEISPDFQNEMEKELRREKRRLGTNKMEKMTRIAGAAAAVTLLVVLLLLLFLR